MASNSRPIDLKREIDRRAKRETAATREKQPFRQNKATAAIGRWLRFIGHYRPLSRLKPAHLGDAVAACKSAEPWIYRQILKWSSLEIKNSRRIIDRHGYRP